MSGFENVLSEVITGLATAAITWFFARRQNELDMTEKAVSIWRNLATDLNQRMSELEAENALLRSDNEKLRKKVDGLRLQLSKFVKNHDYGDTGD